MLTRCSRLLALLFILASALICHVSWVHAQTETATVSGQVSDPSGARVPGAIVRLIDIDRGTKVGAVSNDSGFYSFTNVHPGRFRMEVEKSGFKVINLTGITVNVQDNLEENFKLDLGAVSESMTVEAGGLNVNTTDATVSTVVDRQFVDNIPLNGRSFQALIQMTPGVVVTTNNINDAGQFSVNGQRGDANYWMVDGVSANIGVEALTAGNGYAGTLGGLSAMGGTNGLVSLDALQEFRIQTSSFAPEFGRMPGGQISIVTRSGSNQFHGTAFDYLRNDVLNANDWFGNAYSLPKPIERQNDFGGTIGGPIFKDRTFFFFSYEGLRLRLPEVGIEDVPDLAARKNAIPAMQPYLNAFPLPTPGAPDNLATGVSQFYTSYGNSGTLDAYSIRVDHQLSKKITLFGRYNYSPSQMVQRNVFSSAFTAIGTSPENIQTLTLGATWTLSSKATNEFRFNYSRADSGDITKMDNLGGAVPLTSVAFPSPYTTQGGYFAYGIYSLGNNAWQYDGNVGYQKQRQINIVDTLGVQRGSHTLKFGFDFRRLSPVENGGTYDQQILFWDVPSAETGSALEVVIINNVEARLRFKNLGFFAQDTWRVDPRLTITYGLRWDLDFPPSTVNGPSLPAVTGFNLNNLSNLAVAPAGTPAFHTQFGNVGPRVGMAYQLSQSPNWAPVLRGGFGVFYDLSTSEVGNLFGYSYPFGSNKILIGVPFPLDAATAAPLPISPSTVATSLWQPLGATDPNLRSPYTLQWNVALEQGLGKAQSLTASYVGSVGRRLLASYYVYQPNPNVSRALLVSNAGSSNYNALQVRFQRRLSRGLQALVSYTWAHSIDNASAASVFNGTNALVASINPNENRGPSDFDIRHTFTVGLTYDIPAPRTNAFVNAILHGWSTESVIQIRSALPVSVYDSSYSGYLSARTALRPDVVSGQPLYVSGSQCVVVFGSACPGGIGFNPAAFVDPPIGSNGQPLRQGNLGRNALRGLGAAQWDFAMHRDFPIRESLKLQFRAEMFNVLNHPNFAPPVADMGDAMQFGRSTQMLNDYLGSNVGNGGFSPLYQLGGPRSIQLALKVIF